MAKKSLLEEAIAEAKQVRQAAIQNAVKQLEENLTPSIKEALANQLEEEMDLDEVEEESLEEAANSGFTEVKPKAEKKLAEAEDDAEEDKEKADDEEAEADAEEAEADADKAEADDEEAAAEDAEEKAADDEEAAEAEEDAEEEPSDDTSISDLTVGQLKDMILDIVASANPAPAPEGDLGVDMEPADVEGAGEEEAPIESPEEIPADVPADDAENDENDEEIDLSEILKDLEEEFLDTDQRGKEHDKPTAEKDICQDSEIHELKKKLEEKEKELEETNSKVEELAENLKATNLLNSKLLYTSRLLSQKNFSLSDEQKATAIKTLDEAKSPKDVKEAYKTLCESFKAAPEKVLKENRRFASRSAGRSTAATSNIVPVDETVRRMQQLAGIIE